MSEDEKISHRWYPIEDLPEDHPAMASPELGNLASMWCGQRERLEKFDAMKHFQERLRREWAIETGIIENLYNIDQGITEVLIDKGIEASLIPHGATDQPVEHVIDIVKAQEDALEGVFAFVAARTDLTKTYIRQLHQIITRSQRTVAARNTLGRVVDVALARGEWKKLPNNPKHPGRGLHEYCPPEQVEVEMERLLALHKEHVGRGVAPEIEASWLHHRFTQVHPFQDGNGRIARALASMVFLKYGYFPLVISRNIRPDYIEALEAADRHDLRPLVDLFAAVQKTAFLTALSISEPVLKHHESVQGLIASAMDRLEATAAEKYSAVVSAAEVLKARACERFREVARQLTAELQKINSGFSANVVVNDEENAFWYKFQIVQVAKELGYFADTRTYRGWVRLRISEESQTSIVISFHSLGVRFAGTLAASAFLEHRQETDEERSLAQGITRLPREVFSFAYTEDGQDVKTRFEKWLEEIIIIGLDQWRREL